MASGPEINATPDVDWQAENSFRERATARLLQEHQDLPQERVERWLNLLHDEDPRGRVMAATAVWTMMDVRDARRAIQHQNGILEANG